MSRIGKLPVELPEGVTFEKKDGNALVKGPKGSVVVPIHKDIDLVLNDKTVTVIIKKGAEDAQKYQGLTRSLFNNAVSGVSKEWEKMLEMVGVGYRASGGGQELTLSVGFSHPVKVKAPEGIKYAVKGSKITVTGVDKKQVGEAAAFIRSVRPPEPYKGKGIKYVGEYIRRKAGKAVKAAA